MYRSAISRGLTAALTFTILALAWLSFAPTSFGGSASYVIVAGASMEPALAKGDLVITHRSGSPLM